MSPGNRFRLRSLPYREHPIRSDRWLLWLRQFFERLDLRDFLASEVRFSQAFGDRRGVEFSLCKLAAVPDPILYPCRELACCTPRANRTATYATRDHAGKSLEPSRVALWAFPALDKRLDLFLID